MYKSSQTSECYKPGRRRKCRKAHSHADSGPSNTFHELALIVNCELLILSSFEQVHTGYAGHPSPPTCFVLEELLLDCRPGDSKGTLADMASEVARLMPCCLSLKVTGD